MINFFYWVTGIAITIIFSYVTYKYMKRIKNVKIEQQAKKMEDVKGVDLKLDDGEDIHIQKMKVSQNAREMKNVKGLSFNASGKQSARLQGVEIEQPGKKIIISDDPNIKVVINKQN